MNHTHHARLPQRGAAALAVTLMLCIAGALGMAYAHRNLLLEQRSAAQQYRAAQAFEAAEAGLEWALARLNDGRRIDADCAPTDAAAAGSFRARHVDLNRITGVFRPRTALQPGCVRAGAGWSCACPAGGPPAAASPPPSASPAMPAFSIAFVASERPGTIRVVSTGCSQPAGACRLGTPTQPEAAARVEAQFALIGALRSAPAAAVTTRGAFDAGDAAIGLHNADPATGIAVHAGGTVVASGARLTAPAGAPKANLLLGGDSALAALDAERFFTAHFGMPRRTWATQPGVTRLDCAVDCSAAALSTAIGAAADSALVHVTGNLRLAGPLALGTLARPALIVVDGSVRLDGAVALNGVLHADAIAWAGGTAGAGGAFVRGALLSGTSYRGDGTPAVVYDRAVLDTLRLGAGHFARVPGSWRDF